MAQLARTSSGALSRTAARESLLEFLVFGLGGELYAVQLTKIREILSPPPITFVPRVSPEILGVCSVRGMLTTVLDLRRRLHLVEEPSTHHARVLLVQAGWGEIVGLFVDEVHQVIRLAESEIEFAGAAAGGDTAEHVLGIARPEGRLIVLLDLANVVEG